MHIEPTEVGTNVYKWCDRLYQSYPEAIIPLFKSTCSTHSQVIAIIRIQGPLKSEIRVAKLFVNNAANCYQVYFDSDTNGRCITVYSDGRIWSILNSNNEITTPSLTLVQILNGLTCIMPMGVYVYRQGSRATGLVGMTPKGSGRYLSVLGLAGKALPVALRNLQAPDFWRLLRGNQFVRLECDELRNAKLWAVTCPARLVIEYDSTPSKYDGRIPALVWNGPSGLIPNNATFVQTSDDTLRCSDTRWPNDTDFSLIGQDRAPALLLEQEKLVFVRALL
ncbi:MAG: hypothetical protein PVI21_03295 [Candidatus Woesebacteria bacterium]|jgi:hypothetical protein